MQSRRLRTYPRAYVHNTFSTALPMTQRCCLLGSLAVKKCAGRQALGRELRDVEVDASLAEVQHPMSRRPLP